jgi:hypothetical protein
MNINERITELLKGQPGVRHEKTKAPSVNAHYHHRSNATTGQWKDTFECPVCHRRTSQLANYLGQRKMFCDGIRWTKEKV